VFLLKNRQGKAFTHKDKDVVVFLSLKDACFFKECIKEEMNIEQLTYLPENYVKCEIK
jgi:hypothetical protein